MTISPPGFAAWRKASNWWRATSPTKRSSGQCWRAWTRSCTLPPTPTWESRSRTRASIFRTTFVGALSLLNSVLDAGIRRFVFSSSCAVYGIPEQIPITEQTPREPVNPYGASKLFFENALEAYGRAYGLRSVSLRYFNAREPTKAARLAKSTSRKLI